MADVGRVDDELKDAQTQKSADDEAAQESMVDEEDEVIAEVNNGPSTTEKTADEKEGLPPADEATQWGADEITNRHAILRGQNGVSFKPTIKIRVYVDGMIVCPNLGIHFPRGNNYKGSHITQESVDSLPMFRRNQVPSLTYDESKTNKEEIVFNAQQADMNLDHWFSMIPMEDVKAVGRIFKEVRGADIDRDGKLSASELATLPEDDGEVWKKRVALVGE